MKNFDPYEFIGVIAPGAVVAVGIFAEWPSAKQFLFSKDFSLGDFGVFLIYAFVLGHLIQAVGNIVERIFFSPVGGKPTNWILKEGSGLIAPRQRERLVELYSSLQGAPFSLATTSAKQWYPITRELYSIVAAEHRSERVDAFNRAYGLLRGIASAMLILSAWFLATRWGDWRWAGGAAFLSVLAFTRMGHFAKLYARELFIQFLGCGGSEPAAPGGSTH